VVSAMARDAGLGEALGWIGTMQGVAAVAVEAGPLDDAMYLLRPEPRQILDQRKPDQSAKAGPEP
jgi:hypothetical protein